MPSPFAGEDAKDVYIPVRKFYSRRVTRTDGQRIFREAAIMLLPLAAALFLFGEVVQAQSKAPPYWASISAGEARMRVGPSLDYPSSWVYRRRDLPVRVLQVHGNWRKIEDESGTQGWMHVRLLSDMQTAMVVAAEGTVHEERSEGSAPLYRLEKGVIGRVNACADGWCLIDIGGKRGYIRADELWGAVR